MARGNKQEHDKFFRDIFTRKEWGIELLRLILPSRLFQMLDLDKIQMFPGIAYFLKDAERRNDVVYIVPIKHTDLSVCIIVEHKSNSKTDYLQQLGEALLALRNKRGQMELTISVLFNQSETPWPCEWRMSEYWGFSDELCDTLQGVIQEHQFELYDLGAIDPETVETCLTMRAIYYIMKYIRSDNLRERLERLCEFLVEADDWTLNRVYSYIFEYWEESPSVLSELNRLIAEKGVGGNTVVIADRIYADGVEEGVLKGEMKGLRRGLKRGMEKGIEKGRAEAMQKFLNTAAVLLETGATIEMVLELTGLTQEELEEAGIQVEK